MTRAQDHSARIAELRRGEEVGSVPSSAMPRWEPERGPRFVQVGAGEAFLTVEQAASRLKISVHELQQRAKLVEIGGWACMVALSEVERLEGSDSRT